MTVMIFQMTSCRFFLAMGLVCLFLLYSIRRLEIVRANTPFWGPHALVKPSLLSVVPFG